MRTIIAADLYGVTAQLRSMMRPLGCAAIFVSPWDTEACPFPNEDEAHRAFVSGHGLESYADKISAAAGREPAFIIGFSVGASAAWLHAASGNCNEDSAATLFYGSRIRDYSSLAPKCQVSAIFAETEASCSPAQIAGIIASKRVHTFLEKATKHGFMNPCSVNFAAAQCSAHLQKLTLELARFEHRLS
jgi:dienelactone hydrolase